MDLYWLPEPIVRPPARVGISPIPGKARTSLSASQDLDFLASEGIAYVISLVEEKELLTLAPAEKMKDRRNALKERGIELLSFPIVDFGTPSMSLARALIDELDMLAKRENAVIMHCWAGLGRAGTMLACYLVKQGFTASEAIAEVRWMRPFAIQTKEQEAFVFEFSSEHPPWRAF